MRIFLLLSFFVLIACNGDRPGERNTSERLQLLENLKIQRTEAESGGFENESERLHQLKGISLKFDSLGEYKESLICELKVSDAYLRMGDYANARRVDSVILKKAGERGYHDVEFDAHINDVYSWLSDEGKQKHCLMQAKDVMMRYQLEERKSAFHYAMGIYLLQQSYEMALAEFLKGKEIAEKRNEKHILSQLLANIALAEVYLSDYEKALKHVLEAIAIQRRENFEVDIVSSYTIIALVYNCTGDTKKQRYYNTLALELLENQKRKDRDKINLLNNIGHSYAFSNPDSSIRYYGEALALMEELGQPESKSSVFMNLGNLYLNMGQVDSARKYLFEAGAELKKISRGKQRWGGYYSHLCLFYEKINKIDSSIYYTQMAMDRFDTTSSIGRIGGFRQLAHLNTLKGNYKKAYEYQTEYIKLKDSTFNVDVDRKMIRLSAVHEIEKKDAELIISEKNRQLLDLEVKEKQRSVLQLSVISVLLLLLVGIVLIFLRQKSRSEERLQQKNERIRNLVNEMTHRVKNNFQVLSNVFSLQSNTENAGLGLIRENKARVDALLLLHQKLSMDDTLRKISPVEYINELAGYLVLSYGFPAEIIKKDYAPQIPEIDVDRLMPLGLMVNEMISNALKHAFTGVEHPLLLLKISMLNADTCVLVIRDNGIADERSVQTNKGSLGMRLLQIFARQLQANLTYKIDKGLEWTLEFNIHANFPT